MSVREHSRLDSKFLSIDTQSMPGRCVVGGCSALRDVQRRSILHTIPFLDNECWEARKCQKKRVDFVKQKRAKWSLHQILQYV